jgi:hypothetical protein
MARINDVTPHINVDTQSVRKTVFESWYNEMGEDEMFKQMYLFIQNMKLYPNAHNGNFTECFNFDIISNFTSFVDDGRRCEGIKCLTMSCKKYYEFRHDIWYDIIVKRSIRNNIAYQERI